MSQCRSSWAAWSGNMKEICSRLHMSTKHVVGQRRVVATALNTFPLCSQTKLPNCSHIVTAPVAPRVLRLARGKGVYYMKSATASAETTLHPTRHGEWRLQCPGQSHPCGTGGNPRKFRCCTRLTLPSSLML